VENKSLTIGYRTIISIITKTMMMILLMGMRLYWKASPGRLKSLVIQSNSNFRVITILSMISSILVCQTEAA
jgi:hypothetical protein